MTVLITGGTGFVGSHLAAHLVARERSVRLLVRDPARVDRAPALTGVAVDLAVGDVTDEASVAAAMDGCTAVVHAAAHVSLAEREAERAMAVNVGGTRVVLGAAAERGLPTVAVSSTAVYAIGTPLVTTDSPLADRGGSYSRSKVGAERVARALQELGAPVAIVYPSGILGPDSPDVSANHEAVIGWVRTPPRTTSGTSIVDVRDVALGIEAALDRPGRWMLGGTFLGWADLNRALAAVTGVSRRAVPMPAPLLRTAGHIGELVKRFYDFDYPLTYEAMNFATRSSPFDSAPAEQELGITWRPVRETLADSVQWLAAAGHLAPKLAGRLAPPRAGAPG